MIEEIKMKKMSRKESDRILNVLEEKGFQILSFGDSFDNMFNEIGEEYFNEIINEYLMTDEDYKNE